MEKQLLEYVEQEFKRGVPAQMVKKALREAGWDDRSVEEAFSSVQSKDAPPMPQSQNPAQEDIAALNEIDPASTSSKGKSHRSAIIIFIVVLVLLTAGLAFWFSNYWEPSNQNNPVVFDNNPVVENQENITPKENGNPIDSAATTSTTTDELSIGVTATATIEAGESGAGDNQRMEDMRKLLAAQQTWFGSNKKYYTCGIAGGDCGGKPYGYPSQIGTVIRDTPQDSQMGPNPVCGKDYIYCGLNNAPYPQFFCYYAKLEGGGFYTASHAGNFHRSTAPKIFEECAMAN